MFMIMYMSIFMQKVSKYQTDSESLEIYFKNFSIRAMTLINDTRMFEFQIKEIIKSHRYNKADIDSLM